MADYDSDSSEGEFTETSVLLGYASKDADEDTISKLGGHPDWLDAGKPPSASLARCKVCQDIMVLLLQLNGELPERFPTHERRLYVFACRKATCRRKPGTVRAIRGVRVWQEEEEEPSKPAEPEVSKKELPRLGDALFGATPFANGLSGNANPFSLPSSSSVVPAANPFATHTLAKTFAETLAIDDKNDNKTAGPPPPPEPWPQTSPQCSYPTLYLADAEYETLDDDDASAVPANVRVTDADAPEPSALDREAFESSMDATFQKFADRLAQNPDQVIRYEFAGTPLLYAKTDAVGGLLSKGRMPACANCKGRRTFEVQLTPNAIAELEADEASLDDGMEWGTVIVGVCEKDCVPAHVGVGDVGYLEEWAGVQWEELTRR